MIETLSPMLQELESLERVVSYRQAPQEGQPYYAYEKGACPLLISAPHGAGHTRNGRFKIEDEYTTGFARYLARKTGAHALYTTHFSPNEDPNWDEICSYKRQLRQIKEDENILFVLDLHGMTSRYEMGLAVGTRRGRACPNHTDLIRQTLTQHGYEPNTAADLGPIMPLEEAWALYKAGKANPSDRRWDNFVIDHPKFTGGLKNHTITRYANEELKIPAVQIEISSQIRIIERGAHGLWDRTYNGIPSAIEHTMHALSDITQAIIKTL